MIDTEFKNKDSKEMDFVRCKEWIPALLKNIIHMEEDMVYKVVEITKNTPSDFYRIIALWSYFHDGFEIRNENAFDKITNQIMLLRNFYKTENAGGKYRTYGVFRAKVAGKSGLEFDKVLHKIEGDILSGKTLYEIMPLEYSILKTMDMNEIKVERIKTMFENSIVKSVVGCDAYDFEKIFLKNEG